MSRAAISAIENGTIQEIEVRKLVALCAAIGLDIYVGPQRKRPTLQELRAEQRAGKPLLGRLNERVVAAGDRR